MKLAVKTAGLCGSGMLIMALLTSVFRQMDPWMVLVTAVPAGALGGVLGYSIGDILSKPKGKAPPRQGKKNRQSSASAPPVTGDETFLSDLAAEESAAEPANKVGEEVSSPSAE